MTDHGPALPRAKSTLYDAGTGIAMIIRPPTRTRAHRAAGLRRPVQRRRPAADAAGTARRRRPDRRRRPFARATICWHHSESEPVRDRGLHDEDLSRFVRSDSGDPDQGIQLHRELRAAAAARPAAGTSRRARPGQAVAPLRHGPTSRARTLRPRRRPDRTQQPARPAPITTRPRRSPTTWRCCSNDWRQKTNDVIPSEFAGTRISERYTETYAHINGIAVPQPVGHRRRPRHRRRAPHQQ